MFSALFSFLGGSVFRMMWGEVASFLQKRQDHQHEQEMLRLQAELDDRRAERQEKTIQLQHQLGIQTITVQGDVEMAKAEYQAFTEAMKSANAKTGIVFVDGWNASIRPTFATVSIVLWLVKVVAAGFVMDEFDLQLLAVIAGFYFADRSLAKRGK